MLGRLPDYMNGAGMPKRWATLRRRYFSFSRLQIADYDFGELPMTDYRDAHVSGVAV